ncbi:hypothetical protein BDZ89DRAFT_1057936 [Hymenopellis radicata]|nr:hypothetical protein BDZ89DRAFT_1057936 [Hymenopellis radicata]
MPLRLFIASQTELKASPDPGSIHIGLLNASSRSVVRDGEDGKGRWRGGLTFQTEGVARRKLWDGASKKRFVFSLEMR